MEGRERCRKDDLYLAEMMGYDFVPEVHRELFRSLPDFNPKESWALQGFPVSKWMTLWPRGHYKTTAVVVRIVKIILNFPDIRILIMQGTTIVTKNFLHEIKSHFTGENTNSRIRELFPEFCGDRLGTEIRFTVAARKNKGLAQATVTVASPKSIKTGQHYDIGFFDDLVNDQNYRSEVLLTKVEQNFNMCLPLIDPPHYAVVTGTIYDFIDLHYKTLRNDDGKWAISVKTCWADDKELSSPRFPQQEAKNKPGKMIGFTREGLIGMQENDPVMFAGQYLNRPMQKGGQSITRAMLESGLIAAGDAPQLSAAHLFVDLASSDKPTSDDSVIIAGKNDLQMVPYVVDGRGGKWLMPELAQHVIQMALIHRPERIWFEKYPATEAFTNFLRLTAKFQNIYLPIDFIKVDNRPDAKTVRITTLPGLLKYGKLKFFAGLPIWEKLVQQSERFTGERTRHDDYPDTVALMVQQFTGAAIAMPMLRRHANPILAMMAQREQDTAHIMDNDEPSDGADGFMAFN